MYEQPSCTMILCIFSAKIMKFYIFASGSKGNATLIVDKKLCEDLAMKSEEKNCQQKIKNMTKKQIQDRKIKHDKSQIKYELLKMKEKEKIDLDNKKKKIQVLKKKQTIILQSAIQLLEKQPETSFNSSLPSFSLFSVSPSFR